MNRKSVSIILACIVLGSALGLSGYLYLDLDRKHRELQLDYNSLLGNYYELESNYQTLNDTHQILILEYNELNASYQILAYNYTELTNDYSMLEQDYTDLSNRLVVLKGLYDSLLDDYNSLLEVFNDPLSHEEIPSTYELEQWLAIDGTNGIRYAEPNFVCGDFAVMLSLHAKLKYWDMGVVGVFGHTESFESFDHAFNAITCEEGLVYVEPQTDRAWWYENHEEITEGTWHEFPDLGDIYVEEYIVTIWYE